MTTCGASRGCEAHAEKGRSSRHETRRVTKEAPAVAVGGETNGRFTRHSWLWVCSRHSDCASADAELLPDRRRKPLPSLDIFRASSFCSKCESKTVHVHPAGPRPIEGLAPSSPSRHMSCKYGHSESRMMRRRRLLCMSMHTHTFHLLRTKYTMYDTNTHVLAALRGPWPYSRSLPRPLQGEAAPMAVQPELNFCPRHLGRASSPVPGLSVEAALDGTSHRQKPSR